MAASTLTTTTFSNDTDPHFRTWVAAFIAAIIAGGWTQTADTGQINTATVTAPVAINTSQGYAIFSSNDAGGGLVNFYLKIEFGSGAAASRPAVWVTYGFQGTDGAGNLLSTINPISTRTQVATGVNPTAGSVTINMASGSGYICFAGSVAGGGAEGLCFSVERTKDVNLAFMNQINCFGCINGTLSGAGALAQTINTLNAFPVAGSISSNLNVSMPPNTATPVGGVVGLGLLFGLSPGATSPSLNWFFVESAALGVQGDTITVAVLGVNHNYKLQASFAPTSIAGTVLMSRYE
jgi:hypothetical protein